MENMAFLPNQNFSTLLKRLRDESLVKKENFRGNIISDKCFWIHQNIWGEKPIFFRKQNNLFVILIKIF